MVFDFVYTKQEVLKKDLLSFIVEKMKDVGWEDLSESKNNIDGYTMFSKGESGTENIGVQILPYYDDYVSRDFRTSNYGLISARPFSVYTPSTSLTGKGKYQPNDSHNDIRLTADTSPDRTFYVYYHVNKDRIIFVVENSKTQTETASFVVLGKPHMIGDYDEFSVSSVITSHGSYDGKAPIKDNYTMTKNYEFTFRSIINNTHNKNVNTASTIVLNNELVGEHMIVENIFVMNYSGDKLVETMNKDTMTDDQNRVYQVLVNNMTSSLRESNFRKFMIRIG